MENFDRETGEIKETANTRVTSVQPPRDDGTALAMLEALDRGRFVHNIEDACRDVVMAAMRTGKKGKVTIELGFDYDPSTESMRVAAKCKTVIPEPPPKTNLFFPNQDGSLSRRDKRQGELLEA